MEEKSIQLFENKQIRTKWDEETEKWYFSVIDIIDVLTESVDAKRYWSVLKVRLKKEGAEPTTICSTLKMPASDGKMRLTDVADQEQLEELLFAWKVVSSHPIHPITEGGAYQAVDCTGRIGTHR